jgi:murein L,D-transpeptidase YafK
MYIMITGNNLTEDDAIHFKEMLDVSYFYFYLSYVNVKS